MAALLVEMGGAIATLPAATSASEHVAQQARSGLGLVAQQAWSGFGFGFGFGFVFGLVLVLVLLLVLGLGFEFG